MYKSNGEWNRVWSNKTFIDTRDDRNNYCINFLNKNANFFIYFNHILNVKNTIKLKTKIKLDKMIRDALF